MENVAKASIDDLDSIVHIDVAVIGDDSRRNYIKHAIDEEKLHHCKRGQFYFWFSDI